MKQDPEKYFEVQIPKGYVIDEEKSTFARIVFKPKDLTYDDVVKELFKDSRYLFYIDDKGSIVSSLSGSYPSRENNPNSATTRHQLECIIAKNKLATVAKYLNDGWTPGSADAFWCYCLALTPKGIRVGAGHFLTTELNTYSGIAFKSEDLAKRAIEILGEEEVKLALEPLY